MAACTFKAEVGPSSCPALTTCLLRGCCASDVEKHWRQIDNFSSKIGCDPFMTTSTSMKKFKVDMYIVKYCPYINTLGVADNIRRECTDPNFKSINDTALYIDIDEALMYKNKHCIICNHGHLNSSRFIPMIPARNCSSNVTRELMNPLLSQEIKLKKYVTQCVPILTAPKMIKDLNNVEKNRQHSIMMSLQKVCPAKAIHERLPQIDTTHNRPSPAWLCQIMPSQAVCTNSTVYENAFCAIAQNITNYRCFDCNHTFTMIPRFTLGVIIPPLSVIFDYNRNFVFYGTMKEIEQCANEGRESIEDQTCLIKQCSKGDMLVFNGTTDDSTEEHSTNAVCLNKDQYLKGRMLFLNQRDSNGTDVINFLEELFHMFGVRNPRNKLSHLLDPNLTEISRKSTFRIQPKMNNHFLNFQVNRLAINTDNGNPTTRILKRFLEIKFFTINANNTTQLVHAIQKALLKYAYLKIEGTIANHDFGECKENKDVSSKDQFWILTSTRNGTIQKRHCDYFITKCKTKLFKLLLGVQEKDTVEAKHRKTYGGTWIRMAGGYLMHIDCPSEARSNDINVINVINTVLTVVFVPFSTVSLLVTIIVYGSSSAFRSFPSIGTIHLSFSNILQLIAFFVTIMLRHTVIKDVKSTECQLLSIANQLFPLWTFSWSLSLSILAARTFTTAFGQMSTKNYKVFNALAITIYVPGILYTALCYALSKAGNMGPVTIAYGQASTGLCLISNDPMISMIIGLNAPAALLLLVSLLNMVISWVNILSKAKATKIIHPNNQSDQLLTIGAKLGLLLGLAWFLPLVSTWTNSMLIGLIGNVLLVTQGLLFSLLFLTTMKARIEIRRILNTLKNSVSEKYTEHQ